MKTWKIISMFALALALLVMLPALAEETPEIALDPVNCEMGGEHEVADDAWTTTLEPTCAAVGSRQGLCAKCGKMVVQEVAVNPDAHDWDDGAVTKPATCGEEGVKTYTCKNDPAHTREESIPATGEHTVSSWNAVTAATCTQPGLEEGECTVCGDTVQREIAIDPDAHVWDSGTETTPATCTAEGVMTYTCTLDSAHTKTEPIAIDPDAHVWDDGAVTTPAGCTTEGVKTYTCTLNSAHIRTEPIPAAGHSVTTWTVTTQPTCTKEGVEEGKCAVCGETQTRAVAAAGHEWGAWKTVREATEDAEGQQERTCAVCGETQTRAVQYDGTMPETGVFTLPTALLAGLLALSLSGYAVLKRRAARG